MINFHKVLISTAIVFFLGAALWAGMSYAREGEIWALGLAVGSGIVTVALAVYLKNLSRFLGR